MKKYRLICILLAGLFLAGTGDTAQLFAQKTRLAKEAAAISVRYSESLRYVYDAAMSVYAETMPELQYALNTSMDNLAGTCRAVTDASLFLNGSAVLAEITEDQDDATKAYQAAYNHILDEAWDKAVQAMETFITANPRSRYTDDAAFWKIYATEKSGASTENVFKEYQAFVEKYRSSKWKNDAEQNMLRIGHQLIESGKTEYAAVIKSLQQSNEEEVRLAALYALQNIGDDERALKTTMAMYDRTKSEELRGKIVYMLGNYESPDVIPKLVEIARNDPSPKIRRHAVHALGSTDQPQSIDALKAIVQSDMDKEVRSSALYALGGTDDTSLIPFLRDLALREKEKNIAGAAVYALGSMESKAVLTALMTILEKAENTRAREAALYAISNRDDSSPLPLLERIALEDTTRLRSAAVYAIGNIETQAASKALENIFKKSIDRRTRESALHALANTETESAKGFLKQVALGDTDSRIARTAVYSLGNLTEDDKNHPEIMLEILQKTKHSKVKEAALMQIMEQKDKASMDVVIKVLRNEKDETTRRMAVRVLGFSENNEAVSVLFDIAKNDDNIDLRKEAVRALGQIGTPEAQDAIMKLLGSEQ